VKELFIFLPKNTKVIKKRFYDIDRQKYRKVKNLAAVGQGLNNKSKGNLQF
jgi:hypothetical protein